MSRIQPSDDSSSRLSDDVAGALLLHRDDFQIRLAPAATALADSGLVERMYASRGYLCNGAAVPRGAAVTLQACQGRNIFGTLTVRFDSSDGLAADELYKSEIDAYRGAGGVCELTRLAVDPEFGSKELLGALFHIAYFFAGPNGGKRHMIIEVNPRHVSFYRRMLGFRTAGDCKICPRVDAPAVLLRLEVGHAAAQIANCAGQGGPAKTRSLYPYFCSPSESEEVANRVALLGVSEGIYQRYADGLARNLSVERVGINAAYAPASNCTSAYSRATALQRVVCR
jgi:hypothetical protein